MTTARVTLRLWRVFSARLATEERRSSFRSPVVSSPLMLSGIAPVGSTPPPSGRPSTSERAPAAEGARAAAGFGSGAARAAISSFASVASAEAPTGFQVTSAAGAGVALGLRLGAGRRLRPRLRRRARHRSEVAGELRHRRQRLPVTHARAPHERVGADVTRLPLALHLRERQRPDLRLPDGDVPLARRGLGGRCGDARRVVGAHRLGLGEVRRLGGRIAEGGVERLPELDVESGPARGRGGRDRSGGLDGHLRRAPHHHDVPALLAATLDACRTDLLVRDQVLSVAVVAGEFHRSSILDQPGTTHESPSFSRSWPYSSETQNRARSRTRVSSLSFETWGRSLRIPLRATSRSPASSVPTRFEV